MPSDLTKTFKKSKNFTLNNENRSFFVFYIISGLAIALFAVLAFFFPYTGDDWAWGSSIGIERLKTFFDNYNGRYLGNFVILAISRSKLLKVIVMAVSYYLTCLLCYKYASHKNNVILLFSIALFFIMPRTVFMQSVVWASGYANYVPSAIISMIYILMIRNIAGDTVPHYQKFLFIATFFMGFVGAPFIENIAIFNLCLGAAVILYALIKFKKIFLTHVCFLLGAAAGAVWMFSNSVYSSISNGTDGYRTVPSGISGLIDQCITNGYTICEYLVIFNYLICAVVSALLIFLTVRFVKNSDNKKKNACAIGALTVKIVCLFIIICKNAPVFAQALSFSTKLFSSKKFWICLTVLFALSILSIVLICVEKGLRFKMLLPFYCIPVSVAPLLVVTPIGPRCFYISYMLTMVFAADILGYLIKDIDITHINYKALFYTFSVTLLLQAFLYISIFAPIYKYDSKRNEFAKLQSDNNESNVIVSFLPNDSYLWTSSPTGEPWIERYKLFYGLKDDVNITVLPSTEFDKYFETYNKK
ncbi:MAG: hypothetical protein J6V50_02020 [Clostridia bacterium]|nr:hypothetical protein [Clostridia bacterium]